MRFENVGVINDHYLKATLSNAEKLGEKCGPKIVKMLCKRYQECLEDSHSDRTTYIWRKAIEEHEQDSFDSDYRHLIISGVRDSAMGAVRASPEQAQELIANLLASEFPSLVRIGIYICGEHYGLFGELFWKMHKPVWFDEIQYWHEIYWFVNKCFKRFTAHEKLLFIDIVDNYSVKESGLRDHKEYEELHRRDLLHPAVGQGDKLVDYKYKELVSKLGNVREHPDFHLYSSGATWIQDRSPITSDDIIAKTPEELHEFLISFVPVSNGWGDAPSYRGLASNLTAAVRSSDSAFQEYFPIFNDVHRAYLHGLLQGLKERWIDDKRSIPWHETILFISTLVKDPAFARDIRTVDNGNHDPNINWVISDISDLAQASISDSSREVEDNLIIDFISLFKTLLFLLDPEVLGDKNDAVSSAINSPRGKLIESTFKLALELRRRNHEDESRKLMIQELLSPILNHEIETCDAGLNNEFAALAGMYCANIHYLHPSWIELNFDKIFSISSQTAWRAAAHGFSYQNYVYDWLYNSLKERGHLRKMILLENLPSGVTEKAVQFLGLAYLEGKEELTINSILGELVYGLNEKPLKKLCWFFWTMRNKERIANGAGHKILHFWSEIAKTIRNGVSEREALQSSLNRLAVYITKITPEIEANWTEAARHAQVGYQGNLLLEELSRLSKQYPKEVTHVLLKALEKFVPDFDHKDLIDLVESVAEAGLFDEAESICNEYANRGAPHLLKDTYQAIRERRKQNI
ncbi:hypothetical protein [Herminiimonas aquatilis]|uniref:Uncharacterized protein n=1 Tax=Herminiimonas aquatilis TaxID=345342 RepID=A0ABW2J3P8_9BURK